MFDNGTISSGASTWAANHPSGPSAGVAAARNLATPAGSSRTRKAQPWENPADGARSPFRRMRLTTSGGTGRSVS